MLIFSIASVYDCTVSFLITFLFAFSESLYVYRIFLLFIVISEIAVRKSINFYKFVTGKKIVHKILYEGRFNSFYILFFIKFLY